MDISGLLRGRSGRSRLIKRARTKRIPKRVARKQAESRRQERLKEEKVDKGRKALRVIHAYVSKGKDYSNVVYSYGYLPVSTSAEKRDMLDARLSRELESVVQGEEFLNGFKKGYRTKSEQVVDKPRDVRLNRSPQIHVHYSFNDSTGDRHKMIKGGRGIDVLEHRDVLNQIAYE